MAEIEAPSWGVPVTSNDINFDTSTVLNKYDDKIDTETEQKKQDVTTIEAPLWGVEIKDIAAEESEIDLHNNVERKTNTFPKNVESIFGKRYDELNPEGWGAWVYGWNASQEGMYELLNNIPGSVDRFFDWAGEKTGLDKNDEGFFEEALQNLEYWLTKRARMTNPEYLGLDAPETLRGKVMAGFAAAPITVASYVPASMLLGPVGGFALTDAIRAAEPDAGLLDIAEGAAWGAVYGKTLKWAFNYGLPKRMAIMGGMGYGGSWVQGAPQEDRFANAIVMATLGVPGRWRGMSFTEGIRKEIPGVKTKVEIKVEQLQKDISDLEVAVSKGEYDVANTLIKSILDSTPDLKLADLQITQNIKDFAENVKVIDKVVEVDAAKKTFSAKQFTNKIKSIRKKYGLLEARQYYNKFKALKPDLTIEPIHKIFKFKNEKAFEDKISFYNLQLQAVKVEPKTDTFNKDKSFYPKNEAEFKILEDSMVDKSANEVFPLIKSLSNYKSYLKNLKKSLTDIFGQEFYVYRLMDRNEFLQLAYGKGVDKPISVTTDAKIANTMTWGIGKTKTQRQKLADEGQAPVTEGILNANDPVLVRMKVNSKSTLFKGDENLAELVIDGKKISVKNVELLQDNKGSAKVKLSDLDKAKLEMALEDMQVYLKNDTVQGLMLYRSIIPVIKQLHQERTILESIKKGKYPKTEYDPKTGELKPTEKIEVADFNTHMDNLINAWIDSGVKDSFVKFLDTLPKTKSRFKFPEEIHPVEPFMLVPWIRGVLNTMKGKDSRVSNPDTKLLQDITKYMARVGSIFRRDTDPHRMVLDLVRKAEKGDYVAIQLLNQKVHGFKIIDWVLENGKMHYKVELIPFTGTRYRNIPLSRLLQDILKHNKPEEMGDYPSGYYEFKQPFEFPAEAMLLPDVAVPPMVLKLIEVGKFDKIFKFDGKQGSFVGKLTGEKWLKHQEKEFNKIITKLTKANQQKITLRNKISEDPLDYKGDILSPDWEPTLYGEWRIANYEKGTGDYSNVVTKVNIESVPKQIGASIRKKVLDIEDLKNVTFNNKEIEGTKTDIINPDGQKIMIEQVRSEQNIKEDGTFSRITKRKRKKKLSKEDLKLVDKRIKKIKEMVNTAIGAVSYTDKVAQHITGRFGMNKYELLADLEMKDPSSPNRMIPKYVNKKGEEVISNMYLYTYPGWLLPQRFMKKHPALQYVAQQIGDYMNKIDREVERFTWNLQSKDLQFAEFDKQSKLAGRGIFSTGRTPFGLTLLSRRVHEATAGGLLTRLQEFYNDKTVINGKVGWQRANDVIQTAVKVERDKRAQSEADNIAYDAKNTDGTFKYEVTDKELKDVYKLNEEQVLAYRDVRNTLDALVELYNDKALKYGKLNGVSKNAIINPIPNYIPHMWFGDARIFVNKKGQVDKAQRGEIEWENLDVLHTIGKDNRISAEAYVRLNKEFNQKYPNANLYIKVGNGMRTLKKKGTGDYDVTIYMVDRELVSGTHAYEAINQFAEATRYLTRVGKIKEAKEMESAKERAIASRGFPIHRLKRSDVRGFMGDQFGATASIKNVENFMKAMQSYTEGLLRVSHGWKFRSDMTGRDGILQAKQMEHYPNTKVLVNRMIENAMGHNINKFDQVVHKMLRRWFGERGLDKFLGGANVFGLTTSLLFANIRFLQAQGIQPYQMMIPKLRSLIHQKKLFYNTKDGEGLLMDALVRAQKRMYKPEKEDFELMTYLEDQGVIEAKFFQEFLGKEAMQTGRVSIGGKSIPIWTFAKNLTMKSFVGRMESWSRLQAAMMVYHLLRMGGRSKAFAKSEAAHFGDKYMVQYALHDRPLLFGTAGMGITGKPTGLFKTFQFNYLAQMAEHIQDTYRGLKKAVKKDQSWKEAMEETAGSRYFLTSMILTAGMFGAIAIPQADWLLKLLGLKTLTEQLAESDLPDYLLWGVPSAIQGIDLTTTLAAPGLGAGDLFSVPALDKLGLNPIKTLFGENQGVAQSLWTVTAKAFSPESTATRHEMQVMWKTLLPTSMHGIIEGYYSVKKPTPIVSLFTPWEWGELPVQSGKKGYGIINRNMKDWFSRILSARSLREARLFKAQYAMTILDKRRGATIDDLVAMGADAIIRGLSVPDFIFEEARTKWKVRPDELSEKIMARTKKVYTTLTERWIPKGGVTGLYLMQQEILEGVMNDDSKFENKNFIYNHDQHTNQVEAPSWGVPIE